MSERLFQRHDLDRGLQLGGGALGRLGLGEAGAVAADPAPAHGVGDRRSRPASPSRRTCVALVFSTRLTPHATSTSSRREQPDPERRAALASPAARMRSMPTDVSVNAPSRPNEYMSPSSAIWPRVASTTTTGTSHRDDDRPVRRSEALVALRQPLRHEAQPDQRQEHVVAADERGVRRADQQRRRRDDDARSRSRGRRTSAPARRRTDRGWRARRPAARSRTRS